MEFYLTSFFNMKSWSVKFRNFLGDIPVHYAVLFINKTINNNWMTLLMALHHTHNGFWYFFRCFKYNAHSWYTSNFESANKKPSFIRVAAIKLLPYHSFYGGHILLRKIESPFLSVCLKKIQSHQDTHLAAF